MSGVYEVTVLIQGHDILGRPIPPQGVLEVRRYAAESEDHARQSAALGLTENEEIVDVASVPAAQDTPKEDR